MAILKVDNRAQKPTHLLTDLQVIKHINPSSSFLYHKFSYLTLYPLQPQWHNAPHRYRNIWEYHNSLDFTHKIKKKEISEFKLCQTAILQIYAPFLQTYLYLLSTTYCHCTSGTAHLCKSKGRTKGLGTWENSTP